MARDIVFIHGAFVGAWAWEPALEFFSARGWRCHAPNLRHHEPNADHEALGHTSLLEFVEDLETQIKTFPAPPVIVGHSMGGLLGQILAAGGLASALVLLAPASGWGIFPSGREEYLSRFAVLHAGVDFWRKAILPRFDYAADYALDRFARTDQVRLFAGFVPESGRALAEMLYWPLDMHHAAAVASHKIQCPVFCAVGKRDRVTPPDSVRSVIRRLPRPANYHELEDFSHFMIGEPGFDLLLERVQNWLASPA